jgi:hypothetical protein
MLICYLGFPDLKVGNELPTYRRGIWLFRRGLDSFCSLNNTGVESFTFPAWKTELSRSLFIAGKLLHVFACHDLQLRPLRSPSPPASFSHDIPLVFHTQFCVSGGLMETDLNLVLLKRCILSSWLRHGGNPVINFSDAHW